MKIQEAFKRLSKQQRRLFAVIAALVVVVVALSIALSPTEPVYVSYGDFREEMSQGQIAQVTFDGDTLEYSRVNDETAYRTDNPETPTLREELLLQGVSVSDAPDASDVFDMAFNVLTFVFFVGIIVYGIARLTRLTRGTFKVVHHTGVTFDDVAGMEGLKQELRQVVGVLRNPKAYAAQGVRPVKGIILEGPPGNGKTLFARALASEANVSFIATKGADFQSAFMSMGARKIKTLFRKASHHTPCIVFIDEFDSIGERRNYAGTGIDKENNRIITAMLNEMDGFTGREGILVVAATNSYRSLDPALIRPGRFDLKFTVSNPDAATRAQLVELYTTRAGRKLGEGLTPERLVALFDGASCAAIETVLNGAAALALGSSTDSGSSRNKKEKVTPIISEKLLREAAAQADVKLNG